MRNWLVVLAALLVLFGTPIAKAQVAVDAAKITCKQFTLGSIGRYRSVAYWLSGYLNAKKENTIIDIPTMEKNIKTMEAYCYKHPEALLMDEAKTVFGVDK